MNFYEIPLTPEPQRFGVDLGGTRYLLRLLWCKHAQAWILDISDSRGIGLVHGIPVVTGVNLLSQHKYLGIAGALVASTDHNPDAPPTFDNLGLTGHVYFVTA